MPQAKTKDAFVIAFDAVAKAQLPRCGGNRRKAVAAAARLEPGLHARYLQATNRLAG